MEVPPFGVSPRYGRETHVIKINPTRRFCMTQTVTYQRETKSAPFQGKTIVLENLTPVLTPKVRDKRKKEIERCLFDVFVKYEDKRL